MLLDTTSPGNPSWLEKIQQTFRSILRAFKFFQTPVDKSGEFENTLLLFICWIQMHENQVICYLLASTEAARVRKEYDESSAKLSKIQSRISSLTKKLKHDYG